jgi:hypothetical protein
MTSVQFLVRFLTIVLIAVGTGLLTYGATVDPAQYRAPAGIGLLATPSEAAAWGAGILVGGLLFLVAYGRRRPAAAGKE